MCRAIMLLVIGCSLLLANTVDAGNLLSHDGRVITGVWLSESAGATEVETVGSLNKTPETVGAAADSQKSEPESTQTKNAPIVADTIEKKSIMVNAGTDLMVRTETAIVTGKVKSGDRFTAKTEANLMAGDIVVAPKGTTVYGRVIKAKKAGRIVGVAKLEIDLTDIMIDGQMYPLVTESIGAEGQKSGTLKKVVAGAAIGGIADGSEGAGKGAAVGLGVAVLTKGKQIEVPAGSLIKFRITQPLQINK